MSMNNIYSSFNNNLLKQSRYKNIVDDADSNRVLYEGIKERYDKYVDEWYWSWGTSPGAVFGDTFGNSDEAGKYARPKVKADENKPDENKLDSNAISVKTVNDICTKYSEMITSINKISGELEALKQKIGAKQLYLDNKNYEFRIDDIIDKIDHKYLKQMNEFVEAVKDRAQFVHDFQICVQKDWIRYFGNDTSYGRGRKWWNRRDNGWDL